MMTYVSQSVLWVIFGFIIKLSEIWRQYATLYDAEHKRMSGDQSQIAAFYKGRHVLVTGATGFMGKVLVEKLLRSCPDLERIYLLIRPKKGVDGHRRLEDLVNVALFDTLKKTRPDQLLKLTAVSGDIAAPALGLSEDDQRHLQAHVSVVFHCAATVKFDEALKLSVAMNLQGTKSLVQLCHNMPNLEALVHVSTAYCNCDQSEIFEEVYPPPADPEKIIQCVESLDDDILNDMTDRITKNRPNTYTFTKALAESELHKHCPQLPIAIIRPSIVTASWKEPMPGWVDNLNGATGLLAGAGKGLLRTLLCHRDMVADLIPVDVTINLMITIAWHLASNRPNKLLVYNCTSGNTNRIKWGQLEKWGHQSLVTHPFNSVLWYPGGSFKSSRLLNWLCIFAFHLIPAFLLDTVYFLLGQKPVMLRIQEKVYKATNCLEFFTTHEWNFINDNMKQLHQRMQPEDREMFSFDISSLDWKSYMEQYVLGMRQFIMKEDMKSMESARKHLRRMYWLHQLVNALVLVAGWRVLRSGRLTGLLYRVIGSLVNLLPTPSPTPSDHLTI